MYTQHYFLFIQVPLRLRYPFYGSIHWYVLSKYAQELRQFIVRKKRGRNSTSTEESDCQNGSRHWLKEVAVKKCGTFPSPGPMHYVEDATTTVVTTSLADTSLEFTTEFTSQPPLKNSEGVAVTSLTPEETGDEDLSLQIRSCSPTMPKPHFSNHERGGLLLLVQKMKSNLFQPDIPISINSSSDLLMDIEDLLQSAMSEKTSSLEPSGVGILTGRKKELKSHTRKRIRKHSVENDKMTKSKILKMSHIDTSSNTSKDITQSKQEITEDKKMVDNPDPSESKECSSSATTPSISTMVANNTLQNCQSPMSTSYTSEVMLAINSVCSPATTHYPCNHEIQIVAEQCSLVAMEGLMLASSPAPLHFEESSITRLPNPAFINS